MEKTIFLHVERFPCEWGPVVTDKSACDGLLQMAVDLGLAEYRTGQTHLSTDLRGAADNPGWQSLFAALQVLGWSPFFGYVPEHLKTTHFQVRTIVTYEEAEIEAADLLCLSAWADWHITSFARRNGNRWVGHAGADVGHLTGSGWAQTHGSVDGWRNYFIHPTVRAHFEKTDLQLTYHPLEWDKPELAQGDFWEIDTPYTMPSCLTPISQDEAGLRFYDDAGCEPSELRFRRDEVAAMGDFDAAWTKEEVGKPNDLRDGGHHLIVSQRFRRSCLDYPLEHVSFVPVRLVD